MVSAVRVRRLDVLHSRRRWLLVPGLCLQWRARVQACTRGSIRPATRRARSDGESSVRIIRHDQINGEASFQLARSCQYNPFVYIIANGSKWAGQEQDELETLLETLSEYALDVQRFKGKFWSDDPCHGIPNPAWRYGSSLPHYVDGPRMYERPGVTRFYGNFRDISHVFTFDTNVPELIAMFKESIRANVRLAEIQLAKTR